MRKREVDKNERKRDDTDEKERRSRQMNFLPLTAGSILYDCDAHCNAPSPTTAAFKEWNRNLLMMLNQREADPAKDKSLLSA